MTTASDLDYAHEAGARARENGRALSSCPTYAIGQLGEAWRREWRAGWTEQDNAIQREKRK